MTDPIPSDSPEPSPPAAPASSGRSGPVGVVRNPWAVIGLSIVTCGIYFLYWTYQVFRELKDHTGEGIGGPVALVIGIFVGIVNGFLLPSEISNMYERSGQARPFTWALGFWLLLPIVGFIIWTIKVQEALNARWETA